MEIQREKRGEREGSKEFCSEFKEVWRKRKDNKKASKKFLSHTGAHAALCLMLKNNNLNCFQKYFSYLT